MKQSKTITCKENSQTHISREQLEDQFRTFSFEAKKIIFAQILAQSKFETPSLNKISDQCQVEAIGSKDLMTKIKSLKHQDLNLNLQDNDVIYCSNLDVY